MADGTMSHAEIVERAKRWLRTSAVVACGERSRRLRCGVVLSEQNCTWEIPDAIGWAIGGRFSIVVECKTSRADFLADASKPFRVHPEMGMGRYRYYMAPTGIIAESDLNNGWGLIEVEGRKCRVVKVAEQHNEWHREHETQMLWSALRRAQEAKADANGRTPQGRTPPLEQHLPREAVVEATEGA